MIKIAPETAIKLSCNDRIKHMVCEDIDDITPGQRMLSGALAGAIAQVISMPGLHGALPMHDSFPMLFS